MSAEIKKEIALEIALVLLTDIVGYSKLLINQQRVRMGVHSEPVSGIMDVNVLATQSDGRT